MEKDGRRRRKKEEEQRGKQKRKESIRFEIRNQAPACEFTPFARSSILWLKRFVVRGTFFGRPFGEFWNRNAGEEKRKVTENSKKKKEEEAK